MSTIGAKVQWMPTARASRAATDCPCSIVAGSHDAASAIGTGRIVRSPWITSKPNRAGMPSRWPSIVSRWRRLVSAGSVTNSSDPTPPRARAASTVAGSEARPPTLASVSFRAPK